MKKIRFESRAQEALTLTKRLGYTYAETAKIMGLATKNPGSYIRQANLKEIEPMELSNEEVAAIHKKWGKPTGVEKKPEIEVNGDEEPEEVQKRGGSGKGGKKSAKKEQPKREAKKESKKEMVAPAKKSSGKTSAKSTAKPDSGKATKDEKKPSKEPAKKKETSLEDDFTLGQDVKIEATWQKKKFTRNGKIMGFLDAGQDINELFEKPPSKKNVFRVGDQSKPRLAVVSIIGRIKSFFDPTEDLVKPD
jgi:predicted transcriptional regulator